MPPEEHDTIWVKALNGWVCPDCEYDLLMTDDGPKAFGTDRQYVHRGYHQEYLDGKDNVDDE